MPTPSKAPNQYYPPTVNAVDRAVWDRINYLLREVGGLNERVSELGTGGQAKAIRELEVQIAAVADAQTQAATFVGAGSSNFNSTGGALSASGVGYAIGGTTGAGTITVTSAAAARTAIGLGTMAVRNAGVAVADSAVVAGVAYVQADFQSVIDTVNDLLQSLRSAVHIAP